MWRCARNYSKVLRVRRAPATDFEAEYTLWQRQALPKPGSAGGGDPDGPPGECPAPPHPPNILQPGPLHSGPSQSGQEWVSASGGGVEI